MNFSCFYFYHNKAQFEDFSVQLHLDFKHIPSEIKLQLSTQQCIQSRATVGPSANFADGPIVAQVCLLSGQFPPNSFSRMFMLLINIKRNVITFKHVIKRGRQYKCLKDNHHFYSDAHVSIEHSSK